MVMDAKNSKEQNIQDYMSIMSADKKDICISKKLMK